MGLRDRLNANPMITISFTGAAVIIATTFLVVKVMGSRPRIVDKLPDSYFTIDDGKTFFVANSSNVPPFEYEGKQAVHAYVFQCNGGHPFVGFLEQYTPEARKTILEQKYHTRETEMYGREVKRPGAKSWSKASDEHALATVTDVKCPDGTGVPEPIEP